jgi:hypothetical protein
MIRDIWSQGGESCDVGNVIAISESSKRAFIPGRVRRYTELSAIFAKIAKNISLFFQVASMSGKSVQNCTGLFIPFWFLGFLKEGWHFFVGRLR